MSGFVCRECGWHGDKPCTTWIQMGGRAKQPINVCPECMEVETTIRMCCEEPGCREEASCGTPHASGYKHHCHIHPPKEAQEKTK